MRRIWLQDAHLTFQAHRRGTISFKDFVLQKLLKRPAPPTPVVEALKGVSFEVHDGQRLGIIGHNGAGKSTLLRMLAGVYQPTRGVCETHGRISSLFELSLGFETDATGWENMRYRGYLQRETPDSIRAKSQAIAEFTELGPALDMPIRYYSSGMLVRLAFAIATAIEPEVLLIDEVLAAGDMAFIEKARRRMRELMDRAKAIVVVSHDMASLGKMCDQVLWLHKGEIRQLGPAHETIQAYQRFMKDLARGHAAA
jgi:ABC-type polysaccharide/polyol phosphate transport system ATPase subunit